MSTINVGQQQSFDECMVRHTQVSSSEVCVNSQISNPQPAVGPYSTKVSFFNGLPGTVDFWQVTETYYPPSGGSPNGNHTVTSGRGGTQLHLGWSCAGQLREKIVEDAAVFSVYADCLDYSARPEAKNSQMCLIGAGSLVGQPILPASAEKYRSETDWIDKAPAALQFSRTYRSNWGRNGERQWGNLGDSWTHNHAWKIHPESDFNPGAMVIDSPEGYQKVFVKGSMEGGWRTAYSNDSLSDDGTVWIWRRAENETTYSFDRGNGRLKSIALRSGWVTTYAYDASGRISSVTNPFGRQLNFSYGADDLLVGIATPDGRTITYGYDAQKRLAVVGYADGKTRLFHYENTSFPQALTGITDESGVRWGTFTYDSQGRAISTELAGGVNRYTVSYPTLTGAYVTDPIGPGRDYTYTNKNDRLAVTAASRMSGGGEPDAMRRVLDNNGLTTSETDFNYVVTTTTWDVGRRLPLTVTRASGKPEAQTTVTQWHPIFNLPVLVTESGRANAFTHDAVGNVLTRTVTDTATNKVLNWKWTYNAQQLVETATEPNGAITSYTYDLRGNVLSSTNTLGHVTSYTYDLANRVVSQTEPSGLVTTYTYDARDHLLTQTIGGETTTLTYKPFGSVETIAMPSGLVLTYAYDAAHRLIGWSSNRGESGSFTLDGMGNRIAEQIKDGSGAIALNIARYFNDVNRLATQIEGADQRRNFSYDPNGDFSGWFTVIDSTSGERESTNFGRDNLRRIASINTGSYRTASLKYNSLDGITEATDFKGVTTTYARDAQGNALTEGSVDTGGATTQYDNLGLPSQIVDALGQATTITRDALGRPTSLVFADGKTTTLRYDLTANSKGYLSEIVDRSGTTEYTRDTFGRVTLKKQTLANGVMQQVSYTYNVNGTLASIGYPNGVVLTHVYDATGRLIGLNWNGTPLVSNITWNPLGQPTGWTWAFTSGSPKLAASRNYDTAGRLTTSEIGSYVYDVAGRVTSLTQFLYGPADVDPSHGTIASVNTTWGVSYDKAGRIARFDVTSGGVVGGSTSSTFGYDANDNRTVSDKVANGQTTTRNYTSAANGNRLAGFTQSINGASSTSVTYGYNANGDLLSDGLRSFAYDAEGRLAASTTGSTDTSPTTRYAHNALGQRVFKTEPLYPPSQGDEADPGFMQSLIAFFTKLWSPSTTPAEQLGYAYVYDAQGTLIAEAGSGGANSAGQAQYIYLPTANGPMPIAAVIDGAMYAVHSDHLNTPRRLTNANGQAVWQWSYSAFGEDKPTIAKNRFANLEGTPNPGTTGISEVKFNLRYPGQYADEESGLFYNYWRSYDARTGRYSQPDPIGLNGGGNRFGYVGSNALRGFDPLGLAQIDLPGATFGERMAAAKKYKDLLDANSAMREKLAKTCPKLLEKFDRWRIFLDPNINDPLKRSRGTYAITNFNGQFSQFNKLFFDTGRGRNPSQGDVFAHEFRHLMEGNNRLHRPGDEARDPAKVEGEIDADRWAEQFWKGECEC